MAVNKTQIELLRKLLRHGAKDRVIKTLEKFRPADLAEFFGYLNPIEQKQFIEILYTQERAAETLLELPQGILEEILSILDEDRIASLINRLAPDDGAFFTSLLDDDRIDAVLGKVDENRRIRIDHLRTYPAESAGSLMSADMLTVREDMTVEQAIQAIRERAAESEFIFYVYVVNESKTFLGVVPIRRLIAAQPEATLSAIMVTNPVAVKATDDQEVVVELTARYNLLAVPVVGDRGGERRDLSARGIEVSLGPFVAVVRKADPDAFVPRPFGLHLGHVGSSAGTLDQLLGRLSSRALRNSSPLFQLGQASVIASIRPTA